MKNFYIHDGQVQEGPYSFEELKEKKIVSNTNIWFEGASGWMKAHEIPELKEIISKNEVILPPPFIIDENPTKILNNSEVIKEPYSIKELKQKKIDLNSNILFEGAIDAIKAHENQEHKEVVFKDEIVPPPIITKENSTPISNNSTVIGNHIKYKSFFTKNLFVIFLLVSISVLLIFATLSQSPSTTNNEIKNELKLVVKKKEPEKLKKSDFNKVPSIIESKPSKEKVNKSKEGSKRSNELSRKIDSNNNANLLAEYFAFLENKANNVLSIKTTRTLGKTYVFNAPNSATYKCINVIDFGVTVEIVDDNWEDYCLISSGDVFGYVGKMMLKDYFSIPSKAKK